MADATTITLVIPAAGCGARANLNGNKILAPLGNRPLLWHTLRALTASPAADAAASQPDAGAYTPPAGSPARSKQNPQEATARTTPTGSGYPAEVPAGALPVCEVIIAIRDDERKVIRDIWTQIECSLPLVLVGGGASRQDSVRNAVRCAHGDYVAVHDAARPLVTRELFARIFQAALKSGGAVPALPVTDTVKHARIEKEMPFIASTLPRELVWLAQTPQIFRRDIFLAAFDVAEQDGFAGTDCSSILEHYAQSASRNDFEIALVKGDDRNFKVTFAEDMARAAALL